MRATKITQLGKYNHNANPKSGTAEGKRTGMFCFKLKAQYLSLNWKWAKSAVHKMVGSAADADLVSQHQIFKD